MILYYPLEMEHQMQSKMENEMEDWRNIGIQGA